VETGVDELKTESLSTVVVPLGGIGGAGHGFFLKWIVAAEPCGGPDFALISGRGALSKGTGNACRPSPPSPECPRSPQEKISSP
jgi:hypothetical protein